MRKLRRRQVNPPVKPRREPATERDWLRLMQKVIKRAEQMKDPRLPALRTAAQKGRAAQVLKRMRIICDNDIPRVFPDPTT